MQERRSQGPVLVLDGGDALFPPRGDRDPARAELILRAMAATGIDAAAVGELDLAQGGTWLQEQAKAAGVPYLAANLNDADGAPAFPARRVVEVAGNRVGIFAVLQAHPRAVPEGWELLDPLEAAKVQGAQLREEGVDLLIALVHGPNALAHQIARTVGPDFVLPAHGGASTKPYRVGEAWVLHAGFEGRSVLEVEVDLRGEGTLVSRTHLADIEQQLQDLRQRVTIADQRLEGAEQGPYRQELEELRAGFERDIDRLQRERAVIGADQGKGFEVRTITLDAAVGEDDSFAQEVRKLGG